MKNKHKEI